jgi:hypothetical protein
MPRITHLHLMHRGLIPTDQLGTGTASGATLLRGNQTWRLDNIAATAAPAVTDDSGDGYSIGSRWLDITNDREWVCTDASVGAAVWIETTGGGGGGGVDVEDEGTPLATTATTLDFVGAGVTATGAGTTKTITIPGGGSGTTLDVFGDGQDGSVTINSGAFSVSVGGSALITANTLVRDAYFADLTLNGGDLDLDGYRLFV